MPILGKSKVNCFIGIDPGKSGGIAMISANGGCLNVEVHPMPETERDLFDHLNYLESKYCGDCFAVIEEVGVMPKQGIVSAFTFGRGYGGLRMALIARHIPFETARPQKWQKALGVVKRRGNETKLQFKKRLRAIAQQQFPEVPITLATADALLLAEYAYRLKTGRA